MSNKDNNVKESSEDAELLAPNEKCLVIGSSGYTGIDAVEWDTEELPNIVDYDVIIVDVRALDEKKLSKVSNKRLETLRHQLTRLLHSNGRIIIVSDFKRGHKRPKQNAIWTSIRSVCVLTRRFLDSFNSGALMIIGRYGNCICLS